MTEHSSPEPALNRATSKTGYSAITLNSIIGAGIFGLPAVAAAKNGLDCSPDAVNRSAHDL